MTIQEIKASLSQKLNELSSRQVNRDDIAVEKTAEEMDQIQQSQERILAADSLTRRWETRTLVSEALQRLENKTYGYCLECEEEIGAKRLAALPWAKHCIACQENIDRANSEMRWDNAA